MRLKKKSSLSLSINAIVILVLAISMLGLGLTFTKGMFQKFGGALKVPEPENPATADDPIAVPSSTVEGKDNKPFGFSVSIYNKGAASGESVTVDLACGTLDYAGGLEDAPIDPKSTISAKFLIPASPLGTTDVCTITATFGDGHTLTKQVAIMVVE